MMIELETEDKNVYDQKKSSGDTFVENVQGIVSLQYKKDKEWVINTRALELIYFKS